MPQVKLCEQCQNALPADAPGGLCAKCQVLHAETTIPGRPASGQGSGTPSFPGSFTPPGAAELAVHFPQLEILELLGQGGMGAVYKARQPKLDRLVALKILPPDAGNPAFAERFTREAKALARLNHPNIITIYDFGESGGFFHFVMEFVDGSNLRELVRAGKLAPQEALKIMPQICDALQFAHDEGIVHRDIKPENILVDRRGRVKIADFGIAKLLGNKTRDYTLTGPWQVMGTLNYMAPEQIDNPLGVDHRADIYSLGVVFYEMLTRQLPIGKFTLPSQKAAVDARVDAIVCRALEGEPARRYQQVRDIKTELETLTRQAGEILTVVAAASATSPRTTSTTVVQKLTAQAATVLSREAPAGCLLGLVRFFLIPACLLGLLNIFAAWLHITHAHWQGLGDDVDVQRAMARYGWQGFDGRFAGYQLWQGWTIGAICLGLLCMVIVVPHRRRIVLWRSLIVGLAGLVISCLSVHFIAKGEDFAKKTATVTIEITGRPEELFYYNLFLGPYLLLLGCLELRQIFAGSNADARTLAPPTPYPPKTPSTR
jgi:tRNA A-37 threonylcarbamoyl transferase component Bud32